MSKDVNKDLSMMDVLSTILSRLVNVALFIVISSLALLFMRSHTDMSLGVIALLSLVMGVLGTFLIRLLFTGLRNLAAKFP